MLYPLRKRDGKKSLSALVPIPGMLDRFQKLKDGAKGEKRFLSFSAQHLRYGSPATSTWLAREALLLLQLLYSTGQRAPVGFYTTYRVYLTAASTLAMHLRPRSPAAPSPSDHRHAPGVRGGHRQAGFFGPPFFQIISALAWPGHSDMIRAVDAKSGK